MKLDKEAAIEMRDTAFSQRMATDLGLCQHMLWIQNELSQFTAREEILRESLGKKDEDQSLSPVSCMHHFLETICY